MSLRRDALLTSLGEHNRLAAQTRWQAKTPEQRAHYIAQRRLRRQDVARRRSKQPVLRPEEHPQYQQRLKHLARRVEEVFTYAPSDTEGARRLTNSAQHIIEAIASGYHMDAEGHLRSPRNLVLAVQPAGNVEVRPQAMERHNVSALRFAAAYWFGQAALRPERRVLARNGDRRDLRKGNIEIVTHAERMRRALAEKRARQPDAKPVPYAKIDRFTARAIRYAVQQRHLRIADAWRLLAEKGIHLSYGRVYKIAKGYNYL